MKRLAQSLYILAVMFLFGAITVDVANAQDTWIVGPRTGNLQTIVRPDGRHRTIVYPRRHYGYQAAPGYTQYPNPADAFMQSYRRGAEWRRWLESTE